MATVMRKKRMYKCSECNKHFDEPGHFFISGEFWGAPFTEKVPCCPYCESENYEETEEEDCEDDY